jgi:hypothetical protein
MKQSETEKINRIVRGTFIIHTFKSVVLSVRIIKKYCQFKETGVCVCVCVCVCVFVCVCVCVCV